MEDLQVGIIGEGVTDQIVLESIITGFTQNKNILFTQLQPKPGEAGTWDKVFRYCGSDDFKGAFANPDLFIVIQIDTDHWRGDSVPEKYRVAGLDQLTNEEIVLAMRNLLIRQIGAEFYEQYQTRILFAVSVDQIECWFLGIYQPDKKRAGKTENCTKYLNELLAKANAGFYIGNKEEKYYRTLCKNFRKRADLLRFSEPNDSFRLFIDEMHMRFSAASADVEPGPSI